MGRPLLTHKHSADTIIRMNSYMYVLVHVCTRARMYVCTYALVRRHRRKGCHAVAAARARRCYCRSFVVSAAFSEALVTETMRTFTCYVITLTSDVYSECEGGLGPQALRANYAIRYATLYHTIRYALSRRGAHRILFYTMLYDTLHYTIRYDTPSPHTLSIVRISITA